MKIAAEQNLDRSLPLVVYALKGCLPPACAGVTMVKGLHPPVKGLSSPRRRGSSFYYAMIIKNTAA